MNKLSYKKILSKKNKIPITCLTAYSSPIAKILDGEVDLILIGDSLGTTVYGMKNTRGVTIDMMKNHGRAVVKNTKFSMTIVDMPYNTYRNKKEALNNANILINFTKANFVKIETDNKTIDIVKYLTDNEINVVSHIGITPQHFVNFKKIKSVGKQNEDRKKLLDLATKLEQAGSKLIVLECINQLTAKKITNTLSIPTIGIGSSKYCDGQVLVIDDVLNFNSDIKKPKFVKNFTNIEASVSKAVKNFAKSVKNKKFPLQKHSYK